jgi:hypothetical protein
MQSILCRLAVSGNIVSYFRLSDGPLGGSPLGSGCPRQRKICYQPRLRRRRQRPLGLRTLLCRLPGAGLGVERSPSLLDAVTDSFPSGGTQLALRLRGGDWRLCSCTGRQRTFPAYAQLPFNVSHLLNNFVTFGVVSDERHFQY